jgi:hypothetical protein
VGEKEVRRRLARLQTQGLLHLKERLLQIPGVEVVSGHRTMRDGRERIDLERFPGHGLACSEACFIA